MRLRTKIEVFLNGSALYTSGRTPQPSALSFVWNVTPSVMISPTTSHSIPHLQHFTLLISNTSSSPIVKCVSPLLFIKKKKKKKKGYFLAFSHHILTSQRGSPAKFERFPQPGRWKIREKLVLCIWNKLVLSGDVSWRARSHSNTGKRLPWGKHRRQLEDVKKTSINMDASGKWGMCSQQTTTNGSLDDTGLEGYVRWYRHSSGEEI